jgi:hypothetical protein
MNNNPDTMQLPDEGDLKSEPRQVMLSDVGHGSMSAQSTDFQVQL